MRKKLSEYLFLFDIDGTILRSTGAGKKSFLKAFELLFSVEIKKEISFLGSIDFLIFRDLYYSFGFSKEDFEKGWKNFKNLYMDFLQKSLADPGWSMIPGADSVIKYLEKDSNIALVTGNIKEGAFIKLKKFGLDIYFQCGGYSDMLESRKDIVKQALFSSVNFYQKNFENNKIFLFGDTKNDVDSALENSINPVLIDPDKKHQENYKNWNARFCGNFLNIDIFFEAITEKVNNGKFLYFN